LLNSAGRSPVVVGVALDVKGWQIVGGRQHY
jgi:hypothetical protein